MVPEGRGQRGRRRSGPGLEGAGDGGGGRALKQMGDALTCPVWCAACPPPPPLSPHPAPPSAESPESPEESLEAIFGETDPRVGGGGPQFGGNVATDGVPLVYALLLPVRSPTPRPSFTSPGSLATGVPYMPVCQANHPDRWMLPAPLQPPPPPPTRRPQCLSRPVPAVSEQMSDVQCAGQAPRHAQLRAGRCHPWSLCRTQERGLRAGHAVSYCGDARYSRGGATGLGQIRRKLYITRQYKTKITKQRIKASASWVQQEWATALQMSKKSSSSSEPRQPRSPLSSSSSRACRTMPETKLTANSKNMILKMNPPPGKKKGEKPKPNGEKP